MNIIIGSDHAGYELKEKLKKMLNEAGHTLKDAGTYSTDSCDYPDFAHQVARNISDGGNELGVLVCGSGNGVCMTANKHAGVRAALCWAPEIASLARQHNDANVLCIPARFVSDDIAIQIVTGFLDARFEGGRHQNRVAKIEE